MDELYDSSWTYLGGDFMNMETKTKDSTELKELLERPIGSEVKPSFFDIVDKMMDSIVAEIGKVYPDVVKNKIDGCRRENEVAKELEEKYPESEGYQILRERELCDKDGNPVIDEQTGQKRRIDFVVVKDGKVVDMVEVTSKTAPKRDQLAKEYRIRDNGGNYIKDSNGNIYRIPSNVETRVERRD